ncbi:hypothetical protein [Micromonospora sp. HNM0581]|uniref:hypothetical protein n=1 Tax=Micromonospora sp. HNM0581 TaxID=2716341 RepID=UPI001F0D3C9E|nr:hypothetical protein [Micromonospora sp. HNM0581]
MPECELLKGASVEVAGTGYQLLAYSGGDGAGAAVGWERRSLARLSGTLIDGAVIGRPLRSRSSTLVASRLPPIGAFPGVDSGSSVGSIR